tara:strand:- start:1951 stop:3171 length:1221 start_codon:yes stop_codon:yes gene_type:complete
MKNKTSLEIDAVSAKRIAIAAQGFHRPRPMGKVDIRHFRRVFGDVGLVQLDSVQAICRSHYLVFFSRLGKYDQLKLDNWIWHSGEIFESWAHEASILPVGLEPFVRWKKNRARKGETWKGLYELANSQEKYVDDVMRQVSSAPSAIRASELTEPRNRSGPWWSGRSDGQKTLDWLFRIGQVAVKRDTKFSRSYVPFDSVIPNEISGFPDPLESDSIDELILTAARCNGISTVSDIADYFRMKPILVREALPFLLEQNKLLPVSVEGWNEKAYLHPSVPKPAKIESRALLSPFDSLVWCRPRLERLFHFKYRLEIYVPKEERKYGYYVLPFLLNENLVARVDIKTVRTEGKLLVKGIYLENGTDPEMVISELSKELIELSDFLDLPEVSIAGRSKSAMLLRLFLNSY